MRDTQVVSISPDGVVGRPIGREEAHQAPGVLHLAVSVQVVDPDGTWLLQRRAGSKAAFAGGWTNTCCTHPHVGESPAEAAVRRLGEELGLVVPSLQAAGVFVYRADDPASGLVEHEVDHVFVTVVDTAGASVDPGEIAELARLSYPEALALATSPRGTPWAGEVLRRSFDALSTGGDGQAG